MIQQSIPRPAIKPHLQLIATQNGGVGDAADVYDGAIDTRSGESGGMKRRRQWRAFTAGSNIPASKIGNGGDTGNFGNGVRVANLQSETGRAAGVSRGRSVPYRLAVAANCPDLSGLDIGCSQQLHGRLGKQQAEFPVQYP